MSSLRRFAEDVELVSCVLLHLAARGTGLHRASLRLRSDEALLRLIADCTRVLERRGVKSVSWQLDDIRDATAILRARGFSRAEIDGQVRAIRHAARARRRQSQARRTRRARPGRR